VGVAGYNIGAIGMWAAKAVDPKAFAGLTYTPPAPLADANKPWERPRKASA
jgi:hypothetical protein